MRRGRVLKSISLAATYVAGLAGLYQVAAGATGMMFGSDELGRWFYWYILFIMGLAMFGLFDVGVPSSVKQSLTVSMLGLAILGHLQSG